MILEEEDVFNLINQLSYYNNVFYYNDGYGAVQFFKIKEDLFVSDKNNSKIFNLTGFNFISKWYRKYFAINQEDSDVLIITTYVSGYYLFCKDYKYLKKYLLLT